MTPITSSIPTKSSLSDLLLPRCSAGNIAKASLVILACISSSQNLLGQGSERVPERTVIRENEGKVFESIHHTPPPATAFHTTGDIPFYRVNQFPTTEPQNEPSVRISTKNPDLVVAAYRDFRFGSNPAIRNVGIANSTDGGISWNERLFRYSNHDRYSDPGVAVDTAGNFYVVALSYFTDDPGSVGNALSLMKSTDGGTNWFTIAPVVDRVPDVFEDREMIIVDDGSTSPYSGHVYVSWTRFPSAGPTRILCARSTNGGQTFELPEFVSDAGNVQHSMPATGPDGELYVAWANASSIVVDISIDGGGTFGTDRTVSTPETPPLFFGTLQSSTGAGLMVSGYPSLAVDRSSGPARGDVYAVWMTRTSGDGDIVCSKSTDRGLTWQTPVRVNDDPPGNGADQFFSWVAVDDRGDICIVFLDRRNDPANLLCDAYLARSTDGGSTFTNTRITPQSFDPSINYNADTRFGDYMGIDARLGRIVPIFTSTLSGNQDVYVAMINDISTAVRPGDGSGVPSGFILHQNFPNPFNPTTTIRYGIPAGTYGHTSLRVFDVLGREVAVLVDGERAPGSYEIEFFADGRSRTPSDGQRGSVGASGGSAPGLGSGVYLYRLTAGDFVQTRKMVLVK